MTPPPSACLIQTSSQQLVFYLFYVQVTSIKNLYDTQWKFIYFFRLIIHADYWVVVFSTLFFIFILTYAYPEIWWWMFPKAVNMEGVGWGHRGAAPRKQQQFRWWQSTSRSYTVNVGFKFTLLIMNEYIDLFYPVKRWWHAEGDQSKRTEAGYCNKLQIP